MRKIQALEFVKLRDLLLNNIALAERLEALPSHNPLRVAEAREVGQLSTWVAAFDTYVELVAEAHPGRVKDMLAYMQLLVREAQKYGGTGCIIYDPVFRCNRQGAEGHWDKLDPSLHIAYIAAQVEAPMQVEAQAAFTVCPHGSSH